jgi:hypothetical protein
MMNDEEKREARIEAEELAGAILQAGSIVLGASEEERRRIALARCDAQILVAGISTPGDDARPQITACILRSDDLRDREDIACVGWSMMAYQLRAEEGNLVEWETLCAMIEVILTRLGFVRVPVH